MTGEEKKKSTMTDDEKTKCHTIIHVAAGATGAIGFGLAQIPGSDAIPITAIQVTMIINLGKVFGTEVTEAAAKAILAGAAAAIGGRTVSQFLVGWIPVAGNYVNAATAVSITEGIGWYVANDFADDAQKRKEEINKLEQERQEAEARRVKIEEERKKAEREQKRKEEEAQRLKLEKERKDQERRDAEIRRLEQEKKEAEDRKQSTLQMIISFVASVSLAAVCILVSAFLHCMHVSSPFVNIVSGTVIVIVANAFFVKLMRRKDVTELMQIAQALFPLNFIAAVINIFVSLIYFFMYEAEAIAVIKGVTGWFKLIIEFLFAFWNIPSPFL